jgi:hypothetical protein
MFLKMSRFDQLSLNRNRSWNELKGKHLRIWVLNLLPFLHRLNSCVRSAFLDENHFSLLHLNQGQNYQELKAMHSLTLAWLTWLSLNRLKSWVRNSFRFRDCFSLLHLNPLSWCRHFIISARVVRDRFSGSVRGNIPIWTTENGKWSRQKRIEHDRFTIADRSYSSAVSSASPQGSVHPGEAGLGTCQRLARLPCWGEP